MRPYSIRRPRRAPSVVLRPGYAMSGGGDPPVLALPPAVGIIFSRPALARNNQVLDVGADRDRYESGDLVAQAVLYCNYVLPEDGLTVLMTLGSNAWSRRSTDVYINGSVGTDSSSPSGFMYIPDATSIKLQWGAERGFALTNGNRVSGISIYIVAKKALDIGAEVILTLPVQEDTAYTVDPDRNKVTVEA